MKNKFILILILGMFICNIIIAQNTNTTVDTAYASTNPTKINLKDKDNIPTIYLKSFLNNFKYKNFTFKSNWEAIRRGVTETFDENIIEESEDYISVSKRFFLFNEPIPIFGIKFNYSFLILDRLYNSMSITRLKFIKNFNSNDECYAFYKSFQKKYFIYEKHNSDFQITAYGGDNNRISIYIDDNSFILEIHNYATPYDKSLLSQYDYINTTEAFKEIDADYSFKGINFGTPQSEVKKVVNFKKTDYDTPFKLVTDEKKYAIWKGIVFDNSTYFLFSKEKKLSSIILYYPYNTKDEFDDFTNKIKLLLGDIHLLSKNDKYERWVGKNIIITVDIKEADLKSPYKWVLLYIDSKYLKTEYAKDF